MDKKFNIKEWQQKHLLEEHALGELPSDKLIKMKWNPVKEDISGLKEYGEDEFNRSADMYKDNRPDRIVPEEIPFDEFMQDLIDTVDNKKLLLYLANEIPIHFDEDQSVDLKYDLSNEFGAFGSK